MGFNVFREFKCLEYRHRHTGWQGFYLWHQDCCVVSCRAREDLCWNRQWQQGRAAPPPGLQPQHARPLRLGAAHQSPGARHRSPLPGTVRYAYRTAWNEHLLVTLWTLFVDGDTLVVQESGSSGGSLLEQALAARKNRTPSPARSSAPSRSSTPSRGRAPEARRQAPQSSSWDQVWTVVCPCFVCYVFNPPPLNAVTQLDGLRSAVC